MHCSIVYSLRDSVMLNQCKLEKLERPRSEIPPAA